MSTLIRYLSSTAVVAGMLASTANATTLINDTFAGSAVDTTVWQVKTPFASSSVSISGGDAIFKGRGRLVSVNPVFGTAGASLDIRGSFAFTGNPNDYIQITMRSDGRAGDAWGNAGGEGVAFAMSYFDTCSYGPSGTFNSHLMNYATALQANTYYDFRITDDGSTISVYLIDLVHPLNIVASTYSVGNLLAINDRDENGSYDASVNHGSQINLSYLTVDVVPEPGALALLGLAAAAGAVLRRRTA